MARSVNSLAAARNSQRSGATVLTHGLCWHIHMRILLPLITVLCLVPAFVARHVSRPTSTKWSVRQCWLQLGHPPPIHRLPSSGVSATICKGGLVFRCRLCSKKNLWNILTEMSVATLCRSWSTAKSTSHIRMYPTLYAWKAFVATKNVGGC